MYHDLDPERLWRARRALTLILFLVGAFAIGALITHCVVDYPSIELTKTQERLLP